jgi:hypothetical protein
MQAIQQGSNLNQLSPTKLAVLRGDVTLLLSSLPADIQTAARDAAGPGLDLKHQVFVDFTKGVLTAWRFDGHRHQWKHAGFSDPSGQMTETQAFARAHQRPYIPRFKHRSNLSRLRAA